MTIAALPADGHARPLDLRLADNVKYGTLCDAKNHYFHRMGCAPIQDESEFCGACHQWSRPLPRGAELAIFTEYEEWLASPHRASGVSCQDCHMPGTPGEIAIGAGSRTRVPHHGSTDQLRKMALSLDLSATRAGDGVRVTATIKNQGAGHRVPTGLPGRQLLLRVRTLDGEGRPADSAERAYSRVLVDEDGHEAPFYLAARSAADTRIGPGESRAEIFEFASGAAKEVSADLVWRALSPALAERFPTEQHEQVLAQARIAVPSRSMRTGGQP